MNLSSLFKFITSLLCASMIVSCGESSTQKTINANVWIKTLEPDGHSGATTLCEASDLNKNSPIAELKKFLASNNFIVDTTRLHQLAAYTYHDLRQASFYQGNTGLMNQFNKQLHSMGESDVLMHGFGYYFTQLHPSGTHSGIDLGFEYWKIDTSPQENVEQLQSHWKSAYHPMPFYSIIDNDNLYVLYTRSVQYDRYLRSCVAIVKKHI